MKVQLFLSVICLSCFFGIGAHSNSLPAVSHSSDLIKGMQALEQNQWEVGEQFLGKAPGSLAGDIYYWMKYSASKPPSNMDWNRVSRFVKSHDDWPAASSMKKNAELIMPRDLSNNAVVSWFKEYAPVTADAKLRYIGALHKTGQKDVARKKLIEYWSEDLFGDGAQAKFLTQYGAVLSKSLRQKRLSFLLANRYYDTALHLAQNIGAGEVALVKACKALSKRRKNVNSLISGVPSRLKNHPALVYERIKWRRKKGLNDGAMSLLKQTPEMHDKMNPYSWWKERHIIARRLMDQKNYNAAYNLVSHHKQKSGLGLSESEFLAGWLALRFVNKHHQAYQHFQTLYRNVKTPISKSRGAYWAGRAAEVLGKRDQAQGWYKKAYVYSTTYYGQRAGERMGKSTISLSHYPRIVMSQNTWDKWVGDERVSVMRLLYKAGFHNQATQFLYAMSGQDTNTPEDLIALAKITRLMNFQFGEVKVAKKAAYKSMILVDGKGRLYGYPLLSSVPSKSVIQASHIYAIIRQESEFNHKASSHAGAKGYMQLMPATAKQVARNLGLKHQTSWLISRPKHNVTLGSDYLDGLVGDYNNLILAAAGYNAGPHRVTTWIKKNKDPRLPNVDLIDWVELIPFSETRNYVQRVSEAEVVYRALLK